MTAAGNFLAVSRERNQAKETQVSQDPTAKGSSHMECSEEA